MINRFIYLHLWFTYSSRRKVSFNKSSKPQNAIIQLMPHEGLWIITPHIS